MRGLRLCPYKGCAREAPILKTPIGLAVITCYNPVHPRIRVVASNNSEAQVVWNELVVKLMAYWKVQSFLHKGYDGYVRDTKDSDRTSMLAGMNTQLIALDGFIMRAQAAGDQFEEGQVNDMETEQLRIIKIIEETDWLDPSREALINKIKG